MPRLLIGALLVLAGCAASAEPVDDEINAALKGIKAPGVSVIAVKDGKVVLEKGYGLANVEHRVPMTKDSVHEMASVSKQFTAASILLLDQEGKLSVNDKISKYFPKQGPAWDKVTILQLLHHTSGVADYLGPLGDVGKEWTKKEMVDAIGKKPLEFEPDSKWEYSNSGYMLLGLIVEQASGASLGAFLKRRIFDPLKMTQSCLNNTRGIVSNRADGYDLGDKGALVKEEFTSDSLSATGDGEVMSTVGDLWRWTDALHHGRVLDARHYELMTTPSKPSLDNGLGYGCGIGVSGEGKGRVYSHGGGWTGTSTSVSYCPGQNFFYAVLCNMGGAETGAIEKILEKRYN
jgi:CubicO group peptidase (beta-lactamase class C family)